MKTIDIENLYKNCIYSSIAHAVYMLKEPFFSYEQSWDENNYSIHYGTARGTISFDLSRKIVVGAFRDENSSYVSFYPDQIKAIDFFEKAPEKIREYARNETMMYLYDTIEDYTGPVITAVFWYDNNKIELGENETSFLNHGGSIFEVLISEEHELNEYWKKQYNFSESENNLVYLIFKEFLNNNKEVILNRTLKKITIEKGYMEMIRSLAEVGMSIKFRGLL